MMRFDIHVVMEDGAEYDVVADQRECAAWEMEPFGCSTTEARQRPYLFARFLAWKASSRQGLTKLTWDQWKDACVEARDADVEEAADPGIPVVSAG